MLVLSGERSEKLLRGKRCGSFDRARIVTVMVEGQRELALIAIETEFRVLGLFPQSTK